MTTKVILCLDLLHNFISSLFNAFVSFFFKRFAFIAYVIIVQLFVIYVRYQVHLTNDRTPITIQNPLSNLVQNQLNSNSSGGIGSTTDMVKNMADSFLSSQSTIFEYDLSQAKSLTNSVLFPMVMLWFLHFKMGQVQPLFFQTANGVKDLIMNPLFQCYVLGRQLERPFRNLKMEEMQKRQEEGGEEVGSGEGVGNAMSSDETNGNGSSVGGEKEEDEEDSDDESDEEEEDDGDSDSDDDEEEEEEDSDDYSDEEEED